MPITRPSTGSLAWRTCVLAGSLILSATTSYCRTESAPAVGVIRNVTWSPGDSQRDGASEFEIFLKVAQLQREHDRVGLVGVGNHNGRLGTPAENALEQMVLRGVAVARVAKNGGSIARVADSLYIDASGMPEALACELLARCLDTYGAPPAARNPNHPSPAELTAIHRHLEQYQQTFAKAKSTIVAQQ
jgi:L-asparaginase